MGVWRRALAWWSIVEGLRRATNAPFREVDEDADLDIARKGREFERAGGKVQVTSRVKMATKTVRDWSRVMAKQGRVGRRA